MSAPIAEHGARPLPWHARQWQQALSQCREGLLPHALLISGTPGTGRNRFAVALARTLLCNSPTEEGYCGDCKACRLSAGGVHADWLQVSPDEPGRAIGVDAVRNALRFAAGTATQGMRKVMLLSPAEDMTTAAYNAFLKCLEEPAPGTHIILVAAVGAALPATIRSRCQRWLLAAPEPQAAAAWLESSLNAAGQAERVPSAQRYLQLFGPAPLAALANVSADTGSELLTLNDALCDAAGAYHPQAAERSAAAVDPDYFLQVVEAVIQRWLRARSAAELRSVQGHRAFRALEVIDGLRAAWRAGSNPNPDLLRFRALQVYAGLWQP